MQTLKWLCAVLLMASGASAGASTIVLYEGDVLPSAFAQPFTQIDSATGARSVGGGLLTYDVTSDVGSLVDVREDALLDTDDAVFEFRTRVTRTGTVSPGAIPGGVVQIRWGGSTSGVIVFFVTGDDLILKGSTNNTLFTQALDTSVFHSYRLEKNGNLDISLYVDGAMLADVPFAGFASGFALSGWESFSNNPNSSSQWDYFRYAIGTDLPVAAPVPGTVALILAGMLALSLLQKRRRVGCRPLQTCPYC